MSCVQLIKIRGVQVRPSSIEEAIQQGVIKEQKVKCIEFIIQNLQLISYVQKLFQNHDQKSLEE